MPTKQDNMLYEKKRKEGIEWLNMLENTALPSVLPHLKPGTQAERTTGGYLLHKGTAKVDLWQNRLDVEKLMLTATIFRYGVCWSTVTVCVAYHHTQHDFRRSVQFLAACVQSGMDLE